MKKLIATIIATIIATMALALGGTVALAAPALAENAGDCKAGEPCPPEPEPCNQAGGCTPPVVECPQAGGCDTAGFVRLLNRVNAAEQTANDYRAQVAALTEEAAALRSQVRQTTARAERAERIAAKRAETIQRLRAKIRSLQ